MSKIQKQKLKRCKQNYPKQTESQLKILRKSTLKDQVNKDKDINGKPNTIDVSINQDINIVRNNGNDEHFIDEFVDFKKFVTVKFQNVYQKIANLNMKDQYPTRKHSE